MPCPKGPKSSSSAPAASAATATSIATSGTTSKTINIGVDTATKVEVKAGAIVLDAGANGMTLSSEGALAMDTVGTTAINLGTEAVAKTITIGNDASTKVDINALAIELDSAGTIVLNSVTTTDIQATGNLTLDSSGGAISIGNDNNDGDINIGTQGERTITIGNNTSGSTVDLVSGTGGISLTTTGVGRIVFSPALPTASDGAGSIYTQTVNAVRGTEGTLIGTELVILISE